MHQSIITKIGGIFFLSSFLTACVLSTADDIDVVDSVDSKIETSLWLPEWAQEASMEELKDVLPYTDRILLFTTYFDQEGKPYHTSGSEALLQGVLGKASFQEKEVYITLVNDHFTGESVIQKDPALIEKWLASPDSQEAHIQEILNYVSQYELDGIEIDYEKIPENLTESFLSFVAQLKKELDEKDLSLRVILEPGFPAGQHELPADISFIVMAYNLYGYHSGPGPKADYAFLDEIAEVFSNRNGNIGIALATGGFEWADGKPSGLTDQQVHELIAKHKPFLLRDEESGAMSFTYEEKGILYEVWYADAETLALWTGHLHKKEYTDFSIWRAGGLTKDTLQVFYKLKQEREEEHE